MTLHNIRSRFGENIDYDDHSCVAVQKISSGSEVARKPYITPTLRLTLSKLSQLEHLIN